MCIKGNREIAFYAKSDGLLEEFDDTKWVIQIRNSKKKRQHNGQKKKYKRTNNDLVNKYLIAGVNSGSRRVIDTKHSCTYKCIKIHVVMVV